MKLILILALAVFSIDSEDLVRAGFNKLSEQQKAEFVKGVAQQTEKAETGVATVELADKWANFGIKIGRALSSCAKELNVAVNDFLKTPAGKITFVLIAWKVVATDAYHIFGSLVMLVLGWVIFMKFYRAWTISSIKLNYEKLTFFRRPTKEVTRCQLSDSHAWGLFGIVFMFVMCFAIALFTA